MASTLENPMNPQVQERARIARLRREANGRFASTLRRIHEQAGLSQISDTNMARYIQLDPERSAQRGLPVLMTKDQWKEIQPRLGLEPVNTLFRRSGALPGNVAPLVPKRPTAPSPSEKRRAEAEAIARSRAARSAAASATAAEWHQAVSKAASRGSVAASRVSNGSVGSISVPGPSLPLLPRAPAGAASSASAAALQAGIGEYPNSPRGSDPAGAASSSRGQSRLTLNSQAGSFGAPSNTSRRMNMYAAASRAARPGGKRKTRRSRKTRRQRK
jgi:hypothetical protein